VRLRTTLLVLLLIGAAALVALIVSQGRLPAGVTRGTLTSGGTERSYLLYVPASYDPAAPTPLVLSIHGFASWPANQMEVSQWNELADEHGFILAYPSGTGFPKRWNTSGAAGEGGADDVAFLLALIDALSQQYSIDPQRVYVNGLSNGGGMSNTLACLRPERIAAMGGVAGAYTEPAGGCNPARPVPVIAFHGTADRIVPYTNCTDNAEVIFYTVEGGGHNWPGGGRLPESIVGHMTEDIDASAVMWEFFQQHPLNLGD